MKWLRSWWDRQLNREIPPGWTASSIEGVRKSRANMDRAEVEARYKKPDVWHEVILIGGPKNLDRREFSLKRIPPKIIIGDGIYVRLDDPDDGRYLGAYVYDGRDPKANDCIDC